MSEAHHLPAADYERADARPGVIFTGAALLAFGVAASIGISALMYTAQYSAHPARRGLGEQSFHYGPREQNSIARDWAKQDQAVRQHLYSYGWIDRQAGVVRIPIEQAMQLVSKESAAAAQPNEKSRQ